MFLTAEQILACPLPPAQPCHVPEWAPEGTDPAECFVLVRVLTSAQRDAWEASLSEDAESGPPENLRARFAALVIVGENGKRLFTDAQVEALGELSTTATDRVYQFGAKLNRLRKIDIEDMEKNSASGQPADSSSGSPAT